MQYTIRRIPPALDRALRQRARREQKSLNDIAVEALTVGMDLGEQPVQRRKLRDLAGTWKEDPDFDDAIAAQDEVDASLWR